MLRLLIILALFCLGATDTINTVPGSDANFITELQTFLKDEMPARDNHRFSGVVLYGGYHTDPGATLTATISACKGYPDGYYVSQDAASHTYTASKHTYVFLDADDTVVIKHGTGNIYATGQADCTLDARRDKAMLIYNTAMAEWHLINCSDNN